MKQFIISFVTITIKVIVFVLIARYVMGAASQAYNFGYRIFSEEPVDGEPGITYTVKLSEETTPKQVAQALEDYGLIRDKNLFYLQYMLSPHRGELMPGSYELNTSMTAEQMLTIMSSSYVESEEKN